MPNLKTPDYTRLRHTCPPTLPNAAGRREGPPEALAEPAAEVKPAPEGRKQAAAAKFKARMAEAKATAKARAKAKAKA